MPFKELKGRFLNALHSKFLSTFNSFPFCP
jgi:hypothetical protein